MMETFAKKISDKVYDWYIRNGKNVYGPFSVTHDKLMPTFDKDDKAIVELVKGQLVPVKELTEITEDFTTQNPSNEQLSKDGYMLKIDPVGFNGSIHKLVKDSHSDNGVNVWQNYTNKTNQELNDQELSIWKDEMMVLDSQVSPRMIEDIFDMLISGSNVPPKQLKDLMALRKIKRSNKPE